MGGGQRPRLWGYAKNGMDKKRKEYYRKKLEAKRDDLMRHMAAEEEAGRAADEDTSQDIGDKAANSYTKEFLFSQSDNERVQLHLVEDAIARLSNADFGVCEACGEPVQQKRLEAVPWTQHCIECQEKQDAGQLEETQQ